MVGMEDKHRQLLQSNRIDLARDLDGDLVTSYLYARRVFNDGEKDRVQSASTRLEKNEKVLDILPRKGPTAFDIFCDILKELGMTHLEMLLRVPVSNDKGYDIEDISGHIQGSSDGGLLKAGKADEKPATESDIKFAAEEGQPGNGLGSEYMGSVDATDGPAPDADDCPADQPKAISLPIESDFLYTHSTVAGYYSWRNKVSSSCNMVGMEDKHRELLRSNRIDLARDLDGDLVASYLYARRVFNDGEKDRVQSASTRLEKNEKVLDILPRKGPTAFDIFCDILKELGMTHLEMLLRAPVSNDKGYDFEDISGQIQGFADGGLLKAGKADESCGTESDIKFTSEEGQPGNGLGKDYMNAFDADGCTTGDCIDRVVDQPNSISLPIESWRNEGSSWCNMAGMEDKHRELLRSNRIDLARDLDGDLVASYLYARRVFNDGEKDRVQSASTRLGKNEKVLDILPRKGPTAFDSFCDILKELGMTHLEMLLRAPMSNDEGYDIEDKSGKADEKPATESDVKFAAEEGQPGNGLDQSDGKWFSFKWLSKYKYKKVSSIPPSDAQQPLEVACTVDSDECYKMDKYPRGLFLLVNNRDFLPASGMEKYPRNGTDIDAAALESLFKDLGFNVHRSDNVTSYEMRKLCKQAARLDYSSFSCFVYAILSHGDKDVVYGTDGTIEIKELTKCFQVQSLAGKPKFFIFQACRGTDYMNAFDANGGTTGDSIDGAEDQQRNISLPIESDFLYAYSTVPGYYSWRNNGSGSWFIQALVEVFRKYAHKMDVVHMLTRVNAEVATKSSKSNNPIAKNKKQIPSIVTQLRKDFFLSPPHGPLGIG